MLWFCVTMPSNKQRKLKQSAGALEEDFEAFVRESLTNLCSGQSRIIQDISKLQDKVRGNEVALDTISKKFNTLHESVEGLKGELHDARPKVDEAECTVNNYAKQIEDLEILPIFVSIMLLNLVARTAAKKSVTSYLISLISNQ